MSPLMPPVVANQLMAGLAVAAVERKRYADPLAVVTGNLEAVGAPAAVAFVHRDPTIVAARIDGPSAVPLEQQPIVAHDAIDPLVVDPAPSLAIAAAIDHRPGAPIAVGRQGGDLVADLGDQRPVIARPAMAPSVDPIRRPVYPYMHIGARYTQDVAHDLHRSSPGNKGERAIL
jgi:hypothetical protein